MFLIQVNFSCRRYKKIFLSEFIFLVLRKKYNVFLIWEQFSPIKKIFLNKFWGFCSAVLQWANKVQLKQPKQHFHLLLRVRSHYMATTFWCFRSWPPSASVELKVGSLWLDETWNGARHMSTWDRRRYMFVSSWSNYKILETAMYYLICLNIKNLSSRGTFADLQNQT